MRFAVLAHTLPNWSGDRPDHWDLLIGVPGRDLRAWRLADPLMVSGWRRIDPLPPHRAAYLFLEGSTRRGQGWVRRVAEGEARLWCDDRTAFRATLRAADFSGLIDLASTAAGWRRCFTAAVARKETP